MTGLFIWIGIVGLACLFLWRRARATDDRLHEERAQREASLLAQAWALRSAKEKQKENGSDSIQS